MGRAEGVVAEMFYSGAWQRVPVYTRNPITIVRAKGVDNSAIAKLTIDDRASVYNPTNPTSPLYGLAGRNTPLRLRYPADPPGVGDRFAGEVASYAPGRTEDFTTRTPGGRAKGDAWVQIEAAGILRRYGQGADALPSVLRGYMQAQPGVLAHFPCEDGNGSTAPSNVVPNGYPGIATDVSFGSDDDLPASAGVMTFNSANSAFTAPIPEAPVGFISAVLLFKLDAVPTSAFELFRVEATGSAALMDITMDGTQFGRNVYAPGGGILLSSGTLHLVDPTRWVAMHFGLSQVSPGTIGWAFYRHQVDGTSIIGASGTFAGTLGRATRFTIDPNSNLDGAKWNSLVVTNAAFPFVTSGLRQAVDAWSGWDTARSRIERLCLDAGVPFTYDGTGTAAMGVQLPATLVDLLSECERTDDGMLFEPRDSLGLHYRIRTNLYNQAPALTLNWAAHQIADPFEPVLDDLASRNDVTVQRPLGGSARATLETGPLSVQAPPAGIGRTATKIDVNPDNDGALPGLASWYLHKGTIGGLRYPSITVKSLGDQPGLITAAAAVDIGDRILITGLPADVSPNDASLIVVGYTEVIEATKRRITFDCIPAEGYDVGIWTQTAGPTSARWDSAYSSTSGSITTGTSTSVSVAVEPGRLLWTTNPAHCPFDIDLSGARVRVLAVGQVVNPNPYFETDTSGWSAVQGTFVRSAARAHEGNASGLLTPNGVGATVSAEATSLASTAAAPGDQYVVSGWVYAPIGASQVSVTANWLDAANGLLSSPTGTVVAIPAGLWTPLTSPVLTAPALTAKVGPRVRHAGTPSAATLLYVDELLLIPVDSYDSSPQTFTISADVVNNIRKPIPSGTPVRLWKPARYAL